MIKLTEILIVGCGGFIGATLRFLFSLIPLKSPSGFPWSTFSVNLLGCLLIVLITSRISPAEHPTLLLFLKVGICGGFTTFSSFALETNNLLSQGKTLLALTYCLSSVCLGVLIIFACNYLISK